MAAGPRRLLAVSTGVFTGVAAGLMVADGDLVLLGVAVIWAVLALAVSLLVVPRDSRSVVLPIVGFAIALRFAVAVTLYDGLLAAGREGFVTGDDAGYANLSARLARILHGDRAAFNYPAEGYLLGTFVYLETAVFYVLGPKALAVELLNGGLGGLLVALSYDLTRRLFADAKAAVVACILVAVYPSLVLWSALNLKDSLALVLIATTLLFTALVQIHRSWWFLLLAYVPILLMEGLRGYVFVGLALVVPASVLLRPRTKLPERIVRGLCAVGLSAALLIYHYSAPGAAVPSLADLELERSAMTTDASTSFAEPVHPDSGGALVDRTIRYVPRGAVYVLFAPFPWSARRTLDLLPEPEMLLWYVALVGMTIALIRRRSSWNLLAPVVLFVGGTLLVLALAEGNVGTLFRHRAMVVPFVLILAAPAFASAITSVRRRVRLLSQARRPQLAQ